MVAGQYIVTNIAYGTGPYIRITELGLRINDKLEEAGHDRCQIVVPWIYGEKQQRIIHEEFGAHIEDHPNEIALDSQLGDKYQQTLYRDETFPEFLNRWVTNGKEWSTTVRSYLQSVYGDEILLELGRAPRLDYDITPSYYTSFGKLSEMYRRSVTESNIAVPDSLLKSAAERFAELEQGHERVFVSEPGTFSGDRTTAAQQPTRVPPLSTPPETQLTPTEGTGIYVTVSGIDGLERLYETANEFDYQLYTNDADAVPQGREAPPWLVASDEIKWHFARPGWGSIWLSIFTETPLLVPPWDENDDPEMYFNIQRLEELGIGTVYTGQSFETLAAFGRQAPIRMRELKARIKDEHGTLDGIEIVAKSICRQILK